MVADDPGEMLDWEEGDRFSFEDSDRFEEDSLCSWITEPESICNNWRGWKKPTLGSASLFGSSKKSTDGKIVKFILYFILSLAPTWLVRSKTVLRQVVLAHIVCLCVNCMLACKKFFGQYRSKD